MPARALVLILAAVLLAGCGGGKKAVAGKSSGEASKSAAQVLADAKAATTNASAMHVAGDGFASGRPIHVDLTIGDKGAKGSIGLGRLSFALVSVGNTDYIQGNDPFYRYFASAGVAQLLHGKWLKVPASNSQLAPLTGAFTSAGAFFEQIASMHGKLVNQGLTTYRGQDVVAIHDTTKSATLYVAATGKPYPIAIVKNPYGNSGTITFSGWNEPFSVSAPKNAVDISQLGGA
jgi:hypothetical protein